MFNRLASGILTLSLLLAATSTVMGQSKGRPGKAPDARGGAQASVLYKIFPDYDVYSLSYESYEARRFSDLVEVNAILYDLTKEERTRIESMIQKLDGAPENKEASKGIDAKFATLINERAEITSSLQGKFDVDKTGAQETQQLLTSSGLIKTQAKIASIENARNESINQVRPAIEAMIGPERTQSAYAQWQYRVDQARDRVALKSILQTLRQPKEVRELARRELETKRSSSPPPQKMTPVHPPEKGDLNPRKSRAAERRTARRQKAEAAKPESEPTKRSTDRRSKAPARQEAREKPIPLDKWEQYVRDFIADYKCTPEQTHSALSILSELKGRAEILEKTSAKRLNAANELKDRKERQKRIDEINAPVDRLFEQLKRRLDGLLTTHQRAIKKAAAGTSNRKTKRR